MLQPQIQPMWANAKHIKIMLMLRDLIMTQQSARLRGTLTVLESATPHLSIRSPISPGKSI